ncbi:glycosyltransferase [Cellulosimicrobium sp. BIT-GX5]|uniref:Glycosyltransferase n=1 Tax=Cellulosimicrobium composti TaxID=2672572 RepID=A0A6N7ZG39_9MICO|nr:glycosyltransferase [Cellulosimicrobium composti]MTG88427.1 glycosyltransferase [Cellulosimicrobium composti]
MTRSRLVLLTNEYPFARGDAAFLETEVPHLASAFDDVVVFNYPQPGDEELVAMPPGVRYGGSVKGGSRRRALGHLAVPSVASRLLGMLVREWRAGRLRGRWRTETMAALASIKRGRDARLRAALREPGWRTTVYAYWAAGAGLAVAGLPRSSGPVALRLHRYDLYEEEQRSGQPLRASLMNRADVVLAISEHGRDYLLEHYPEHVDSSWIELSRLGTADHGVQPQRVAGGPLVVVSCSSLTPVKRTTLILDAVHALSRSRPVRWVHLGGGPLEHDLRERASAVADAGLEVELRGQMSHDEVIDFFRSTSVDVFVNASASEGVPVSIMEALSFDVPVVATDVGGTGEIVGEAHASGILVAADVEPSELAASIERAFLERERFAPRETWRRLSDADENGRRTAQVVAHLTPRRKGQAT